MVLEEIDNKKGLQTNSWTDRADAGEFSDRKKSSSGLRPEELIISKKGPQKGRQI